MANLTQTFSPLTPALYPSFLNLSPKCETFLNPLSYIRKPMVVHHFGKGPMAEWLGSALQKLLQRFESASDLIVKMESPVVTATAGLLLLRVPTRVPTDGLNPSLGVLNATNRIAVNKGHARGNFERRAAADQATRIEKPIGWSCHPPVPVFPSEYELSRVIADASR